MTIFKFVALDKELIFALPLIESPTNKSFCSSSVLEGSFCPDDLWLWCTVGGVELGVVCRGSEGDGGDDVLEGVELVVLDGRGHLFRKVKVHIF